MSSISATKHPYIDKNPEIQGGKAVITGTRIMVSTIVTWHLRGADIQEIIDKYPHVRPSHVYDALSYYYDHKEEIDTERTVHEDDSVLKEKYPPGKA